MPELTSNNGGDPEDTDPAQRQLEDILEERLKGPSIPVPDDLVERVMEKTMERVRQRQTAQHQCQ